jgi:hypothetical protein
MYRSFDRDSMNQQGGTTMTLDCAQMEEELDADPHGHFDVHSTYFVVPMASQTDRFLTCAYYRHNWRRLDCPPKLSFCWKHRNGNFVKIIRPHDDAIRALRAKSHFDFDPDIRYHLFAAVARTRTGEELLPNVFHAVNNRIIVPALSATGNEGHRALVLIFSRFDGQDDQFHLRSTSDPIITPDPAPHP